MPVMLLIAGMVSLLVTLGLFDMAVDVAKRHGVRYAAGEFMAAFTMLMLAVFTFLLGAWHG